MKTLFLYMASGQPVIPQQWEGLNLLIQNEAKVGHVVDNLNNNLVETIDLGLHGYGNFVPEEGPDNNFLFRCADQVARYIYHGPIDYDLIVTGQTPASEHVVRELHENRTMLEIKGIIRFSSYYGDHTPPHHDCLPPDKAGYDFDFPKDFVELYDFLNFPDLKEICAGLDLGTIIQRFNSILTRRPILTISR